MISYLVFGLWPGVQQPSSDHRPTEGEDCTGEEHRTYARPPGEQSQHGAAEPKREVEKDGVSAHCQAAALRRAPPHGFDAEARIDEGIAKTGKRRAQGSKRRIGGVPDQRQAGRFDKHAYQGNLSSAQHVRDMAEKQTGRDQGDGKRTEHEPDGIPAMLRRQ